MKLSQKLILGFVSVASLVALVGYIAVGASQKALQKSIGESSTVLATKVLDHIDRSVYGRIETFQEYSRDLIAQQLISESNRAFEKLDDIQAYIDEQDQQWTSVPKEEVTPFMRQLMDNELSEELIEKIGFYEEKYGYKVFGEIFVTNKYGANAAQTGKTTDYYQADEQWWQIAKKHGLYVADVGYDRSADVYSTDICIRIDDEAGNFLGVMKVVLNIEETINPIKKAAAAEEEEEETVEFKLLTKDGRVIYATEEFEFLQPLPVELSRLLHSQEDEHCQGNHFIAAGDNPGEGDELFAHAHSKGYRDFKGLGWILVVEHETDEIFAPVAKLRTHILIVAAAITGLAILLGFVISKTLSDPIGRLAIAAAEIGIGNLDTRIKVKSNDEVGQLATSFNKMAEDIEREIAERKKAEEKIKHEQDNLKAIFDAAPVGMLLIDKNMVVKQINSIVARLAGKRGSAIINTQPGEVLGCIHSNDAPEGCGHGPLCSACPIRSTVEGVLSSGKAVHGVEFQTTLLVDGNEISPWLGVSIEPLNIDRSRHVIVAINNITERKQAEEALRVSREQLGKQNEFLNNILESLTHPFYVIDVEDYTIKMANSATGFDISSENSTCYALTHKRNKPCSGDDDPCPLKEIKKTKRPITVEHIHYDKDGNPRNVEVHGYPIFDSAGNISQMIEYTLDITERKRAEEKLQKSEEKYKTLLENLPQGIFLKDRNSVYVSCNQNYARDLKIKPEEIAGRTDYEFYDKELAEKYRGDDKRIMEAGTTEDIEEKYIRNGQEMIVQTVKTPIKDEEGSIVGILGIFWDITDLKHAQEAIERLSKFPFEDPNPVLRVQKDGKILYGNNVALSLLAKWKTKVGGAVPAKWRRLVDKAFESEKAISDDEEVNDRIFSFVVAPILDGDYVNLYARDVTERKKAEEAVEVSNRDLTLAVNKLEEANRELKDFVYIASHDLREPMRKISSFGELLKDSLEDKLEEDDKENLEFMIDGANRMTAMIDGLLTYSRVAAKATAFETVDLNEIVEQLRTLELAKLLEETGTAIEVPQPLPKVQAEPVQMRQLLQNLIANGIKYRREGIQPRIVIKAEQIADGKVRVEIQDNGIGIAKEYQRDVFKMFKRLHSRQKYEGTGIGLAVCKKIVERHNGQIGVESEAGAGSTFWFTLPVSESSKAEQREPVSSLET